MTEESIIRLFEIGGWTACFVAAIYWVIGPVIKAGCDAFLLRFETINKIVSAEPPKFEMTKNPTIQGDKSGS